MGQFLGYQVKLGDILAAFLLAVIAALAIKYLEKFWALGLDEFARRSKAARRKRIAKLYQKLVRLRTLAADKPRLGVHVTLEMGSAILYLLMSFFILFTISSEEIMAGVFASIKFTLHPSLVGAALHPSGFRYFLIRDAVVVFVLLICAFATISLLASLFAFRRVVVFRRLEAEIDSLKSRLTALRAPIGPPHLI